MDNFPEFPKSMHLEDNEDGTCTMTFKFKKEDNMPDVTAVLAVSLNDFFGSMMPVIFENHLVEEYQDKFTMIPNDSELA